MVSEAERRRQFADVVLPHLDDALTLARWLTGNLADAEDVVQDASLRAYRALDARRDGSARAWLLTITRNTAYSWLAKNRPKSLIVTDDDRLFESHDQGAEVSTPETTLLAKAEAEMLQQLLSSLPISFREVLVLREIEGLSYREISAVMTIPVGTVMSRLARARALLAAGLERAMNDGRQVA